MDPKIANYNQRITDNHQRTNHIIIVSGLPRSGTSMMMKILEAGGLPVLVDNLRSPDDDNPKGYYEFERAKKLKDGDTTWLVEAQGKVVKVISALLTYLPATYTYNIVFSHRAMPEILASQRKMLIHRGEDPNKINDDELSRLFEKHLTQVNIWINSQPNIKRIDVNYNQILKEPGPQLEHINQFFGNMLDFEKMLQVIDPNLYRQHG